LANAMISRWGSKLRVSWPRFFLILPIVFLLSAIAAADAGGNGWVMLISVGSGFACLGSPFVAFVLYFREKRRMAGRLLLLAIVTYLGMQCGLIFLDYQFEWAKPEIERIGDELNAYVDRTGEIPEDLSVVNGKDVTYADVGVFFKRPLKIWQGRPGEEYNLYYRYNIGILADYHPETREWTTTDP